MDKDKGLNPQPRIFAILGVLCGVTAAGLVAVAQVARLATLDCETEQCIPQPNLTLPLTLAGVGLLLSIYATYRAFTEGSKGRSLAINGIIISIVSMVAVLMLRR